MKLSVFSMSYPDKAAADPGGNGPALPISTESSKPPCCSTSVAPTSPNLPLQQGKTCLHPLRLHLAASRKEIPYCSTSTAPTSPTLPLQQGETCFHSLLLHFAASRKEIPCCSRQRDISRLRCPWRRSQVFADCRLQTAGHTHRWRHAQKENRRLTPAAAEAKWSLPSSAPVRSGYGVHTGGRN